MLLKRQEELTHGQEGPETIREESFISLPGRLLMIFMEETDMGK